MADERNQEFQSFKNVSLDDSEEEEEQDILPKPPLRKRILKMFVKNYLPLMLIFLVSLGILVPAPGAFLAKYPTHYICIVGLFLHSGIKLKTGEIKDAIRSYKALILQIVIIMLITPIIGVKLTGLLPFNADKVQGQGKFNSTNVTQDMPSVSYNQSHQEISDSFRLGPQAFKIGIQMYFVVPCTISAGVVLVENAAGNAALALMTTVICNLMAVFTVPPMIKWLMSFEGVKIDIVNLLVKLILTVLLPLLVGKSMRYIPKVKPFVKRYSITLKTISVTLLVSIPWMKVSVSSAQGAFNDVSIGSIFAILGFGLMLHFAFMIMNLLLSLLLRIDKPALKCIVILASQKSLTVAVTILALLPFSGKEQGIMALPIVVIHLGVLVIDALIVTIWHNCEMKHDAQEELNGEIFLTKLPQEPESNNVV